MPVRAHTTPGPVARVAPATAPTGAAARDSSPMRDPSTARDAESATLATGDRSWVSLAPSRSIAAAPRRYTPGWSAIVCGRREAARRRRDPRAMGSETRSEARANAMCVRVPSVVHAGAGCIFPNSVLRFVYEYKDSLDVYRLCFRVLARAVAAVVVSRGGTRRRHGGGSHERGACARGDVTRAFVSLALFRGVSRERAREREISVVDGRARGFSSASSRSIDRATGRGAREGPGTMGAMMRMWVVFPR